MVTHTKNRNQMKYRWGTIRGGPKVPKCSSVRVCVVNASVCS